MLRKLLGKGTPILLGNRASSSSWSYKNGNKTNRQVLNCWSCLDPSHEEVNVLGSWTLDWLLDLITISPVVLDRLWWVNEYMSAWTPPTSYLGPADMTGQDCSVQNSVMVPYNMLIWLKKSTVFTATHSFRSSPSGSITARRRLPHNHNYSPTQPILQL